MILKHIKTRNKKKANKSNCRNIDEACGNCKRGGFTLIEMVIVVTIIGILSGIVAIKYSSAQKIARENADYANASVIATAAYLSKENGDEADIYTSPEKLKDKKYLDGIPKVQSKKGEKFSIESSGEGDGVVVKVGNKVFYPKQDGKDTEK